MKKQKKPRGPKNSKVRLDSQRLRQERLKRVLTMEQLAYDSDDSFSLSTYKRAEAGQEISVTMARAIASYYETDLQELIAKAFAQETPRDERKPTNNTKAADGQKRGARSSSRSEKSDSAQIGKNPFAFLLRAATKFVAQTRELYDVDLTLSNMALHQAFNQYMMRSASLRMESVEVVSLDATRIGSIISCALNRYRPVVAVHVDGPASPDQVSLIVNANEMMAVSIGTTIAHLHATDAFPLLVEMMKKTIDDENLNLVFRMLRPKPFDFDIGPLARA